MSNINIKLWDHLIMVICGSFILEPAGSSILGPGSFSWLCFYGAFFLGWKFVDYFKYNWREAPFYTPFHVQQFIHANLPENNL